jgi:hypothetical protein
MAAPPLAVSPELFPFRIESKRRSSFFLTHFSLRKPMPTPDQVRGNASLESTLLNCDDFT